MKFRFNSKYRENVPPKFLKRLILQRFEYCLNFPFLSVTLSEKKLQIAITHAKTILWLLKLGLRSFR